MSDTVIFAFGRFQPPTIGHRKMFDAIKQEAANRNADHVIYVSRTFDHKNNPLPIDVKLAFLKKMFPDINFEAANDQVRTPVEAAKALNIKYQKLVFVAGDDRIGTLGKVLVNQNSIDYKYEDIELVSSGVRDPDSTGAEGMSATILRTAAKQGDFITFQKGLPSTLDENDARILMEVINTNIT
jgi:hypothetical protein